MAGSGFSDYVPEEKFLGPPSPKNLATPLGRDKKRITIKVYSVHVKKVSVCQGYETHEMALLSYLH